MSPDVMKKAIIIVQLFVSFCCLFAFTVTARTAVSLKVDWQQFLSRHDMVWEVLPEQWYEAAYMGNGMLGLMIYKEPGKNVLRLETGNCAVHDHRPGGNGLFHNPRLLTGHFELHPVGEITGGTMQLDLWNAETVTHIVTTKGKIHLRSFVHADRMVIVTQATTEGYERDFRWQWVPARSESPRYLFGLSHPGWVKPPKDYPSNPEPEVNRTAQGGTSLQRLQASGETAVCWQEMERKEGRTLWVNLTHRYPADNACEASRTEVEEAVRQGFAAMQQSHRRWWHDYYPVSFVTLPDGVKESFYWIQLYKLASATRGDRALIDCTGPWLTVTPWPNAWWNLNVQLTYWPLNASNHLDLAASLENALYNNVEQLRRNVPEAYRETALGIGRFSDLQCASDVIGIPGVSPVAEVGLLTWACHNLWLIYRHKMDNALLRDKLFPLLKGAVGYYLHFLKEGADGKLHLPATYSPEYGSAEDCNFDLALLRWGCRTLVQAAGRLQIEDPSLPQWNAVLRNLTPAPTDSTGLSIGKNVPYATSHRHYSHLLSVYPLYLLNKEQGTEAAALIEKSLRTWQGKTGTHQGYSLTGASSISAALGKGDDALRYLDGLFGRFLSCTTMYREAGPVIETPLSGAQCIHDMLLQSWDGKLRLFPAVPSAWQDVSFHNLLAEGAFEVSAKREKGKTVFASIRSLAGEPCTVVTDMVCPIFKGKAPEDVTRLSEGVYRINLEKGEVVTIHTAGTSSKPVIAPIEHETVNYYGKKAE
jgi:alpha-L-fucosidase 2